MESPAAILERISKNKGKDANDIIMEKTKGTTAGALIGGGIGLFYAFMKKKNYLVFGVLGIMAGGLISNLFIAKEINKPAPEKDEP